MKKSFGLMLIFTCIFSFINIKNTRAQTDGKDGWLKDILVNYTTEEQNKMVGLMQTNKDVVQKYLEAYMQLSSKVSLYGGGLNKYLYRLPNDDRTEIGLCQGWHGNFFYMKKKSDISSTEYIKIWEIGSAKIIKEEGSQYILIYPRQNKSFEKRTWVANTDGTRYGVVNVIRFYVDWTQEEGLINTFNDSFNAISRLNNLL
ncbi:hypothetical protein [Pedobacter sp. ASV28]|uniref:hypothetical protein n=1 Tax=Pedobacter sp. ASV28 TaxID=2795123 RepID=UPI0018ECB38A|nr:hypothetical protein [Pedobacter sp. ASV28]